MPSRSKPILYNLTQAKRNTQSIASFGGVDFSSQKFNVASHRAIDIKNFIYKDGVVQKRNGYEQVFTVRPIKYVALGTTEEKTNPCNINSIWRFKAEDNEYHIIAHIGCLLFEVKNIGTKDMSVEPLFEKIENSNYVVYEFENYKSQAFVGANRLWFLGGNKFMCLRFTEKGKEPRLFPVKNHINDSDKAETTFIPTTSIGVTYKNALTSATSGLDFPNKLTMWRENRLITGVGKEEDKNIETKYFEYTLDGRFMIPNAELEREKIKRNNELSKEAKEYIENNTFVILKESGVI